MIPYQVIKKEEMAELRDQVRNLIESLEDAKVSDRILYDVRRIENLVDSMAHARNPAVLIPLFVALIGATQCAPTDGGNEVPEHIHPQIEHLEQNVTEVGNNYGIVVNVNIDGPATSPRSSDGPARTDRSDDTIRSAAQRLSKAEIRLEALPFPSEISLGPDEADDGWTEERLDIIQQGELDRLLDRATTGRELPHAESLLPSTREALGVDADATIEELDAAIHDFSREARG